MPDSAPMKPLFARRHYEAFAEILRDVAHDRVMKPVKDIGIEDGAKESVRAASALNTILDIRNRVADLFERDNPRFDREKFLDASTLELPPPTKGPTR